MVDKHYCPYFTHLWFYCLYNKNSITDNIIKENNLTCLMITHKIQDAIDYGNRLIMIHDGQVLFDISGEKKEKQKLQDIIEKFQIMKTDIVGSEIF